jgi:predicted Rossmann fold nucleotide-binding protein DprA/Smf involved in DNA uptake
MAFFVESWSNSGGWIVSRSDSAYPTRLKTRLRQSAPPVLYGIGNRDLLEVGGVAVVGARNADEPSLEFTRRVATRCAELEIPVISGGARGVDRTAMLASLSAGGEVVGVLANNLSRAAVSGEFREFLLDDMLALVSPYHPKARFFVGHAMGRNKHIYALSDMALAVSVTEGKGGTWSGAVENEKHGWVPLYVRAGNAVPAGNEQLLRRGALPLQDDLQEIDRVAQHWRSECGRAANRSTSIPQRAQISAIPEGQDPSQLNLF